MFPGNNEGRAATMSWREEEFLIFLAAKLSNGDILPDERRELLAAFARIAHAAGPIPPGDEVNSFVLRHALEVTKRELGAIRPDLLTEFEAGRGTERG